MYMLKNDVIKKISEKDWNLIGEFEAVLNVTKIVSTLSQYESLYTGAFKTLLKLSIFHRLRSGKLQVVDVHQVNKSPTVIRTWININEFSDVGEECVRRCLLEGERRWCGNKTEILNNSAPVIGHRELLSTLLDIRTVKCHHLTRAQRESAVNIYLDAYLCFYRQCRKFDKKDAAIVVDDDTIPLTPVVAPSLTFGCGISYNDISTWSDDEDVQEGVTDDGEIAPELDDKEVFSEASAALKKWRKHVVNWALEYPNKVSKECDILGDLMQLDVGPLYLKLEKTKEFGLIPSMALSSFGQLGALNAESFAERVLSTANDVLTEGNSLLGHEEVEMLVLLRINKKFMKSMREKYSKLSQQDFNRTIIHSKDND